MPYLLVLELTKYTGSFIDPLDVAFVDCLKALTGNVDERHATYQSWQVWEEFGALFHALRINALQIVYRRDVGHSFQVSKLFPGAVLRGCTQLVKLRPMTIQRCHDAFGSDMKLEVGVKGNSADQINWLTGGHVWLNADSGKGVDIFYALQCLETDCDYIIVTDQRKRVAGSNVGPVTAKNLLNAQRVPNLTNIPNLRIKQVCCLFNQLTRVKVDASDLPENSIVVALEQSDAYHATLWNHPAASPTVKLNSDPKTFIKMLFDGARADELAEAVVSRRAQRGFSSFDEFHEFAAAWEPTVKIVADAVDRVIFC